MNSESNNIYEGYQAQHHPSSLWTQFIKEDICPAYFSATMRRLFLNNMVKQLPQPVQHRIVVLRNIQWEQMRSEEKQKIEIYKLNLKYQKMLEPLYSMRKDIINGKVEVADEQPKWTMECDEFDVKITDDYGKTKSSFENVTDDTKGIPNFWLTVFKTYDELRAIIYDYDEPLLVKLNDVTVKYHEDLSFTLHFHFDPNEYFSDTILTKKYFLRNTESQENSFIDFGLQIWKCIGCKINWKPGNNITRIASVEGGNITNVCVESFFTFFDPPELPAADHENYDEVKKAVEADFEIGDTLRTKIIPKAALYFAGVSFEDTNVQSEDNTSAEYEFNSEGERYVSGQSD